MGITDHLLAVHRRSSPLGTESPTTGLFVEWGPEYVEIPDTELQFRKNKHDFSGEWNEGLVNGNEDAETDDELDLLSWAVVGQSGGEEVDVGGNEANQQGLDGHRVTAETVSGNEVEVDRNGESVDGTEAIVVNKDVDENEGSADEMEGVLVEDEGGKTGVGKMEGVIESGEQAMEFADGKRAGVVDGAVQWSKLMRSRVGDRESML